MTPARRERMIRILWVAAIVVIWSAFHLSDRLSVQFILTPFDLTTLRVAVVPAAVTIVAWYVLDEPRSALGAGGVALVVVGMMAGGVRTRPREPARA